MAETQSSLQSNHPLQSYFAALDPMPLLSSQNSHPDPPAPLQVPTDCYIMERGPRYRAYSELREARLRMKKRAPPDAADHESRFTPPKKQVKFHGVSRGGGGRASSVLSQSVPDLSVVLRKENWKPVNRLPALLEMTPPGTKSSKIYSLAAKLGGSKSTSAGEKKGRFIARKSYASLEELKGLSSGAANAINGENRGGGTSNRGIGKSVLGSRQF